LGAFEAEPEAFEDDDAEADRFRLLPVAEDDVLVFGGIVDLTQVRMYARDFGGIGETRRRASSEHGKLSTELKMKPYSTEVRHLV
jgi:hypothetical protein